MRLAAFHGMERLPCGIEPCLLLIGPCPAGLCLLECTTRHDKDATSLSSTPDLKSTMRMTP